MGFYIKDLYVTSSRWFLHDRLTNPPTVPETSPVLVAAKYQHVVAKAYQKAIAQRAAGSAGAAGMPGPDDDGSWVTWTIPTFPTRTTSPYLDLGDILEESDYLQIREVLKQSLETVERTISALSPDAKQLDQAIDALDSARGGE
jgi:hypothetical protein